MDCRVALGIPNFSRWHTHLLSSTLCFFDTCANRWWLPDGDCGSATFTGSLVGYSELTFIVCSKYYLGRSRVDFRTPSDKKCWGRGVLKNWLERARPPRSRAGSASTKLTGSAEEPLLQILFLSSFPLFLSHHASLKLVALNTWQRMASNF